MVAALVLLADDSATVRALAKTELEGAGYEVIEAVDGQQALALAISAQPDVVLLDIEMPVMDGYQTVQALKADPRTTDIPVVFLTGRAGAQDVVRALKLGGHDYLRKPPDPAELLARVSAAVRVTTLHNKLRAHAGELEALARTDYLTGLHNRRHLEEHLESLVADAKRHGYPLAVLLIDIDHFKQVNDTLGHETGDVVLREVAARLRGSVRGQDIAGRWGGEEFLVLLPHTAAEPAALLAERLRSAVSAAPILSGDAVVTITVSVGGSAAEGADSAELLSRADAELYAAKEAGRDQVRMVRS